LPYKNTEGLMGKALSGWTVSGVTTIQNGEPFTVIDGGGGTIYGVNESRGALANVGKCSAVTGNCTSATPIATSGSNYQRVVNGLPGGSGVGWINPAAFTPLSTSSASPHPLPQSSPYCIGGYANPGGGSTASTIPCGDAPGTLSATDPGAVLVGAGSGFGNSQIGSIVGPGQFNFDVSLVKNTKVTEWGTLQFRAEFYNIWNHPQFNPPAGTDVNVPATFGIINSSSVTPRIVQFALKFLF